LAALAVRLPVYLVSEAQMDRLYPPKRRRFFLEDRLRERLRRLRERYLEEDEDPFAPLRDLEVEDGEAWRRQAMLVAAGLYLRRLAPGLTYRGYIPSKRAYFHGLKLHLVCDNHPFITEALCTPGSVAAVQGLYLLPLDLAQGSELYVDRGTRQRTTWRWPGASCKGNSRRYHQPSQFIATLGRKIIESVGSALTELFPLWDSCHHPPGLCAQGLGLHLCPQLQAPGQRFVGGNLGYNIP